IHGNLWEAWPKSREFTGNQILQGQPIDEDEYMNAYCAVSRGITELEHETSSGVGKETLKDVDGSIHHFSSNSIYNGGTGQGNTFVERQNEGAPDFRPGQMYSKNSGMSPVEPSIDKIKNIGARNKGLPVLSNDTIISIDPVSSINKSGRIWKIFLDNDGFIVYKDQKIPLSSLYGSVFFNDGISIFAGNRHIPYIINNTFIVIAIVQVTIYDLEAFDSREITYNYMVHCQEEYLDYQVQGNNIYIDGKQYYFDFSIMAVYLTREIGRLSYLVRLLNNIHFAENTDTFKTTGLSLIHNSGKTEGSIGLQTCAPDRFVCDYLQIRAMAQRSSTSSLNILVKNRLWTQGVPAPHMTIDELIDFYVNRTLNLRFRINKSYFLLFFTMIGCIIAVLRRNLRYRRKIDDRIYEGTFIRQSCLMYEGRDKLTSIAHCDLRNSGIVVVFGAYRAAFCHYWLRSVVITEFTWQYLKKTEDEFRGAMLAYAKTLEHLHSLGRVHGKICPENMRVLDNGSYKIQSIFDNMGWKSSAQISEDSGFVPSLAIQDDLFSFGCLIHYYLTGHHPYDSVSPKRHRIKPDELYESSCEEDESCVPNDLSKVSYSTVYSQVLDDVCIAVIERNIKRKFYYIRIEEREAHDLIYHCLFTGNVVLSKHPFFWDWKMKAEVICDFSDFIDGNQQAKSRMETFKNFVFSGSWIEVIDKSIMMSICRRRPYDGSSLCDLIRVIRNSHRHLHETANRTFYDQFEGGVAEYYTDKFPKLFMVIYRSKVMQNEKSFEKYF
ncbi:serine/threonine-protein kinase/endoribonuclease IRE1, partial [Pancytospora epiphaga]